MISFLPDVYHSRDLQIIFLMSDSRVMTFINVYFVDFYVVLSIYTNKDVFRLELLFFISDTSLNSIKTGLEKQSPMCSCGRINL